MQPGKGGGDIPASGRAVFDRMFGDGASFGGLEGDLGGLTPQVAAGLYAERIEAAFVEKGFGDFDVSVDGATIDLTAFNGDGSSVNLILEVDDAMGLGVVAAEGISVQNGDRVGLEWWFEDGGMKFADVAGVARFAEEFAGW